MMRAETITDADMIFFYMSMLDYLKPKSVLDVGMFLKRAGFVSRQAMSGEISGEIRLCGIDFFPEQQFAVYEKIYSTIVEKDAFFERLADVTSESEARYDAAVLLGLRDFMDAREEQALFSYLRRSVNGVMTEPDMAQRFIQQGFAGGYQPVSAGEKEFVWIPVSE